MSEPTRTGARRPTGIRYEFLLPGRVSEAVCAAFPELIARSSPVGGTVMFGQVVDRAHLHGLLDRFQTMGLTVVEFRQLPD